MLRSLRISRNTLLQQDATEQSWKLQVQILTVGQKNNKIIRIVEALKVSTQNYPNVKLLRWASPYTFNSLMTK